MMQTLEYAKIYSKQMLRNPSALFFTLCFPAILVGLFGSQMARDQQLYTYIVYCNFAVQTVAFQALGIAVATERVSEWNHYLKVLPVATLPSIFARLMTSMLFAMVSLGLVLLAHSLICPISLSLQQQALLIGCAFLGGLPMALLAILLAQFLNPTAARSAFVLVNTLLLFGSFTMLQFIPSYQWAMLSLSAITMTHTWHEPLMWLLGYSVMFYLLIVKLRN